MPDLPPSILLVEGTLRNMGYHYVDEKDGLPLYRYDGDEAVILPIHRRSFSSAEYLEVALERNGINLDVFYAHYDALG